MFPVALSVQLFTFYHNRVHLATSKFPNPLSSNFIYFLKEIESLGGSQKYPGAHICSLAPPSPPTISHPLTQYIFVFCFSTRFEVPYRRNPHRDSLSDVLTNLSTYLFTNLRTYLRTCLLLHLRIPTPCEYPNRPNVQYAWGYLPLSGLHVMMYLDLIGRVAGNGNNKVMDLDPILLNGV